MKYAWDYVREDILRERKKERQKGRKDGIVEGIRKVTKEMLRQNMNVEEIKMITKLSEEELNKIREELKLV